MSKQINAADVRVVGTRDSATAILRKLGVKPRDYNFFISKRDDGKLVVAVEAATAHLQSLLLPSTPAPKVESKAESKATPAPKAEKKVSCSKVAQDLILAGKTNDEVWAVIAEQFNLDQKKRGYPAWYRFQLRKAGHKV